MYKDFYIHININIYIYIFAQCENKFQPEEFSGVFWEPSWCYSCEDCHTDIY